MSGIRIRFFGTGDAFASGGRHHACIHVSAPGTSVLLDCGGSALPAIKRYIAPATIQAIAVSHLHGDHFGGIPYLVMEQHFAGRTAPLDLVGPRALADRLRLAGDALFPDFYRGWTLGYPLPISVFGAEPVALGGARVSALPVRHVPESDPHGLRLSVGGALIAYSGDAVWGPELVELAKGADLFICEATNWAEPDPVHMSYRELVAHRDELDCPRVVVTHLGAESQTHLDDMRLEHAADGAELTL